MESKMGMLESFLKSHQSSLKSLFNRSGSRNSSVDGSPQGLNSPTLIPHLCPFTNSVVARSSKTLQIPTEELQHCFDTELPESAKQTSTYARNFLEFCSYQALHLMTRRSDYLSAKEFHSLTYDMMLAWESPGAETGPLHKVDDKKTVGPEAFA